ncbi:MAG TPA: response regulator transcription factor [Opitutaceae bacterium]|jgi:DNA-binding NarL/FixJ family response regulator|nr:response regulator transcription factor [Opitutaceae bacterium]
MITVSIVEDHRDTRESLVALVNGTKGLRCLSTYATGEAALRGVPVEKPQIALVDINLPGMSGIECVAKLKAQMPSLEVLMLTTYEESELIFNSLRAGANGYLLKNMPPDELVAALEQVHAGGAPMSMQIARKVVDHFHKIHNPSSDVGKLTPREHEILTLLAKGCLDKEIVDKLGISFTTVRTHLKHIYEKLHVQTRTEATAKFLTQ